MVKNKTPLRKTQPDIEAKRAKIKADSITEPDKIRRSGVHHAGRAKAYGNVEVEIRSQHPNSDNNPKRPPANTVLTGDKIEIESRKIIVNKPTKAGEKYTATAGNGVNIFGKLRSVKK